MNNRYYIGWSRDGTSKVRSRPIKEIANAVTLFSGGGRSYQDEYGMGNTSPYVVVEFE